MYKNIVLFLFSLVFFCGCDGDLKHSNKEKNSMPVRSEYATNPRIYYSENAIKKALATGKTMMRREDTLFKTYFPDGIQIVIYDSVGNMSTTVNAKYGEQNHTNQQMIARDSVRVVNVNGKKLNTNHLIWMPNENKMVSYGAVEIRDKDEVIYGDTLYADENLKRYVVKKVRGIVHVTK